MPSWIKPFNWKNSHPVENTLIIVTADHETGGLIVPDQTITPGTVPALSWTSTGHTAANVPIFATWPAALNSQTIDNTEVFNLMEDFLNYSFGGKPPVIEGLSISSVTETGAVVQWSTAEPSTSELTVGDKLFQDPTRTTAHSITCTGLAPGNVYDALAGSSDLGGFKGTAAVTFTTKAANYNAVVSGEPAVVIGTVNGTIQGVSAPNDGLTQSFSETLSGAGSKLDVTYTLHTPTPVSEIDTLVIQGKTAWSQFDGASDTLRTEIRVLSPGGYTWQPITFPFQASPASSYVDSNGNILIRFADTASIRKERKDTLRVDYLQGQILTGNSSPLPSQPTSVQVVTTLPTSLTLNWVDSASETGYYLWRYSPASGWTAVALLPEGQTTFTDTGLVPATTYTYVVRAFNAESYTDSAMVEATTLAGLLAPSNLKATSSRGAIVLTWLDPNTTETGYQILRGSTIGGNFTVISEVAADATSYTDKSVVRGNTYFYQVRGCKGAETGPTSPVISATAK